MKWFEITPLYEGDRTIRIGRLRLPWPFPLSHMLHSSAAMILGQEVYGKDHRWVIRTIHKGFECLSDIKWWIKYRCIPRHRHHVIDTGLYPGWHDGDKLMLHGCFALLRRYIERECGGIEEFRDSLKDMPDNERIQHDREAIRLYEWWTVDRPAQKRQAAELSEMVYSGSRWERTPTGSMTLYISGGESRQSERQKLFAMRQQMDADDDRNLESLIRIRHCLWT